jgi:hypothetical protein
MIKISNFEAKKLNELGVNYGENGISHTYGHNRHYFLCESKKNMNMLEQLRQKSIIKAY